MPKVKRKGHGSSWGDKIKPIPVPDEDHPPFANPKLPAHEFTWGMIGPPGVGKTTVMCNFLMMTKGYFHNIFIISPSIEADDKWDYILKQPLLAENKRLKKWLKELEDRHKKSKVVEDAPKGYDQLADGTGIIHKGTEEKELFDPKIPEDCIFRKITGEQLKEIMDEQDKMVKLLKKHGASKYLANRILFLFDDMVGSNLFSGSKKNNVFLELTVRHRHFVSSLIVCTQGYKEVPKTNRTAYRALSIFKIDNFKELECIYEENPLGLNRDNWQVLYEHATETLHDFLFINRRIEDFPAMKNMDQVLFFKPDKEAYKDAAGSGPVANHDNKSKK